MYAGRKIEEAPVAELFARPAHPYTQGLLASVPQLGAAEARPERLYEIPGIVPAITTRRAGCAFAPRCAAADAQCDVQPALGGVRPAHTVACWRAGA